MITREALDKVRDELAAKLATVDNPDFENGFDAAVEMLWPVIEACEKQRCKCSRGSGTIVTISFEEIFDALAELKEKLK
jgi:hypothetical protein